MLGTLNGFEVSQSNNDGFEVWEWLGCGHFYKPTRHLEILEGFSILCVIFQMSQLFDLFIAATSHPTSFSFTPQLADFHSWLWFDYVRHLRIEVYKDENHSTVICVCSLWCKIISSVSSRMHVLRLWPIVYHSVLYVPCIFYLKHTH